MINEILKSTGDKNYKFFCKMFNMWSDVIFSKQIEINDESITEYFKDLFCFTRKFYGEFTQFEFKETYLLCFKIKLEDAGYVFTMNIFHMDKDKIHIETGASKRMLQFNYYLDGIRQRKCSKNSI